MTSRTKLLRVCILLVASNRGVSFISHTPPSLHNCQHSSQQQLVGLTQQLHRTTSFSHCNVAKSRRLLAQEQHLDDDDDDDDDDATTDPDDVDDSKENAPSSSSSGFSPQKWKKKRYMMMKDVDDLIEKGDPRAPHKAQELVQRMQRLYSRTGITNYKPTEHVYNLWINAIAKCSTPTNQNHDNRGREAEAVLDAMKEDGLSPSVITFTSIMHAYARSNHPQAAQDAERVLFDYLQQQQALQSKSSKVSSITCDAVLNAWAQRGTPEAAERAQFLLERLEQFQNQEIRPTAHSYATVIHAWALCGQATKAQAILERLLQRPPEKAATGLDTVVCNAVLHAWATSGDPQAGTRALHLFHRMQQLAREQGYDTHPDVVTYNTLLSAWSHSGHLKAATQAEKILQDMIQAHQQDPQTSPNPNAVSYNSVLHAWSRSSLPGAAKRAQSVLEYMIRASQTGTMDIAPDVYSFTSVLNAWAKSKEPNKAAQARDLLQTMLDLYDGNSGDDKHPRRQQRRPELQPTQAPFNAVLNACAFSALGTSQAEQRQALQVSVSTFAKLRQYTTGPDTVSYGNLLKCIANLMPVGTQARHDMALQTFRQCCEDGLVGELVWTEIQRAVPARLLRTELANGGTAAITIPGATVRNLPRAWKRNVLRTQNKKTTTSTSQDDTRKQATTKQSQAKQQRKTPESQSLEGAVAPVKRLRSITEPSYSSRDVL